MMKCKVRNTLLMCIFICSFNVSMAASPLSTSGKFSVLSVDMGAGCAIRLLDLYGGHLQSGMPAKASYWTDKPPVRSSLGNFGINFECHRGQPLDDVAKSYGSRWDVRGRRWAPYYEDRSEQRLAGPVSRIYQLQTTNATGFLRTTDQINGEESERVRFYAFCLFRADIAICGDGQSRFLKEPSGDFLLYILRVLRSVEFINSSGTTDEEKKP